jgi:hypothetical protein
MSVFENVIAFLFQHDATEILVSGFLILVLYLFASEFFMNRNQRRQKRTLNTSPSYRAMGFLPP